MPRPMSPWALPNGGSDRDWNGSSVSARAAVALMLRREGESGTQPEQVLRMRLAVWVHIL